jgi:methionyl-tRNA formyltransferase
MKLLYLTGPYANDAILSYLRSVEEVDVCDEHLYARISPGNLYTWQAVIACNYKHVIPADVFAALPSIRVNCHISLLPWNRGSQPNYWAWKDSTPHGVTLHQITPQLDRGPIYAQREVTFGEGETLATSHARLEAELFALFRIAWPEIKAGRLTPLPQVGSGSYHDRAAFAAVKDTLRLGWQTPVSELVRERVTA